MTKSSNWTPRIAVIGLEGSGKTVLITTLAKRLSTIDDKGIFLNPQSVTTLKYVERTWAILQQGQWPPSTPPGEMFDLHWKLQVVGGEECELRLVDVAGQDLRRIFGQELHLDPESLPEHMRTLIQYCQVADILLVLVNIKDFVGEGDHERHIDNQAALKSAIDALNPDGDKEVALIFTQYDLYEESIRAQGGLGQFLMREMNYIFGAHVHGKPTMTMTLSAVNDTEVTVDENGIPYRVPAKNFSSKGFGGFVDWLIMAVGKVKDMDSNVGEPDFEIEEIDEEDSIVHDPADEFYRGKNAETASGMTQPTPRSVKKKRPSPSIIDEMDKKLAAFKNPIPGFLKKNRTSLRIAAAIVVCLFGVGMLFDYLATRPTIGRLEGYLNAGRWQEAGEVYRMLGGDDNFEAAMVAGEYHINNGPVKIGLEKLRYAASRGYRPARKLLGKLIISDPSGYAESTKDIEFVEAFAEDGDPLALLFLGRVYFDGAPGLAIDPDKGIRYLSRAIDKGNIDAMALLGGIYANMASSSNKAEEGLALLDRAAQANSSMAYYFLAAYWAKRGDYSKSWSCLDASDRAALSPASGFSSEERKVLIASKRAELCYHGFDSGQEQFSAAYRWARIALDVNPNEPMAGGVMGMLLADGLGGAIRDPSAAVRYLERVATPDNALAMVKLGQLYLAGDGVSQDTAKAVRLFEGAAEVDSLGLAALGRLYFAGQHVAQDYAKAFQYFYEAMSNDGENTHVSVRGALGYMYFYGKGTSMDRNKGLSLLKSAADDGDSASCVELGVLYTGSEGVARDMAQAVQYLQKAAAKGNPNANMFLGGLAKKDKDYKKALALFEAAAAKGFPLAKLEMGKLYYSGALGIPDYQKALDAFLSAGMDMDREAKVMVCKMYYLGLSMVPNMQTVAALANSLDENSKDPEERLIFADLTYSGTGLPANKEKGMRILRELAQENMPRAKTILGNAYLFGDGVENDPTIAIKYFEDAAKQNDPLAEYRLGILCYEGRSIAKDPQRAVMLLTAAADQGFIPAQSWLGRLYCLGDPAMRKNRQGMELLTAAADKGDPEAAVALAEVYLGKGGGTKDYPAAEKILRPHLEKGNPTAQCLMADILRHPPPGGKVDFYKAQKFLEQSAAAGHVPALMALGEMYYIGEGVKQSHATAANYFSQAAEKGDVMASRRLAEMSKAGIGVVRDQAKAANYLEAAAKTGDAAANSQLGDYYYDGKDTMRDLPKAFNYYSTAAEKGDVKAIYRLGQMYYDGQGVTQNTAKGVELLTRAADQGSRPAMLRLGQMYYLGEGVQQDDRKAVQYLGPVMDDAPPRAKAMLGWLYYYGRGVEQSNAVAMDYLESAGKARDPLAASLLAKIYCDGEIVVEDYDKARKYAELGCEIKNPVALCVAGKLKLNGNGGKRDVTGAIEMLRQAADMNDIEAQYTLGKAYYEGKLVPKDFDLADRYLGLASRENYKDSKVMYSKLVR